MDWQLVNVLLHKFIRCTCSHFELQTLALLSKEEKVLSKQTSEHSVRNSSRIFWVFPSCVLFSCLDLKWAEDGLLELWLCQCARQVVVPGFLPHQKCFPEDPKTLEGLLGYVILPMSLESNSLWPRRTWPGHLSGETLNQIPELTGLTPLDAKEQFPCQKTL